MAEGASWMVDESVRISEGGRMSEGERTMSETHRSILVVDDDVPVARLAARLLERLGYTPTVLHSGEAALERVRKNPSEFDAIVTDHRMPGMTGLTMIRAIREAGIRMPILVVSGYGEELTPESLAALDVGPVLSKPYSRDDLATRLQGLLASAPPQKA